MGFMRSSKILLVKYLRNIVSHTPQHDLLHLMVFTSNKKQNIQIPIHRILSFR